MAGIDPNRLTAVKLALKAVADTLTYDMINVGKYVTDDELAQMATAAIEADDAYGAAPSI